MYLFLFFLAGCVFCIHPQFEKITSEYKSFLSNEIEYGRAFDCEDIVLDIECLYSLRKRGALLLRYGDYGNLKIVANKLMEEYDDWYGYYLEIHCRNLDSVDVTEQIERLERFLDFECQDQEERILSMSTLLHLYNSFEDFDKYADELFSVDDLTFDSVYFLWAHSPTNELQKTYFQRLLQMNEDDAYVVLCYYMSTHHHYDALEKYILVHRFIDEEFETDLSLSDLCAREPTSSFAYFIKGTEVQGLANSINLYKKSLKLLSREHIIKNKEDGSKYLSKDIELGFPTIFTEIFREISYRCYLAGWYDDAAWAYRFLNDIHPTMHRYNMITASLRLMDDNVNDRYEQLKLVFNEMKEWLLSSLESGDDDSHSTTLIHLASTSLDFARISHDHDDFETCCSELEKVESIIDTLTSSSSTLFLTTEQDEEYYLLKYLCLGKNEEEDDDVLDPELYLHLGVRYRKQGRYEDALELFEKCIQQSSYPFFGLYEEEEDERYNYQNNNNIVMENCFHQKAITFMEKGEFGKAEKVILEEKMFVFNDEDDEHTTTGIIYKAYDTYMYLLQTEKYVSQYLEVANRVVDDICCEPFEESDYEGDHPCNVNNINKRGIRRFYCSDEVKYNILVSSTLVQFGDDSDRFSALETLTKAQIYFPLDCLPYDLRIGIFVELEMHKECIAEIDKAIQLCQNLWIGDQFESLEDKHMNYYASRSYRNIVLENYEEALRDTEKALEGYRKDNGVKRISIVVEIGMFNKAYSLEKLGRFRESLDTYIVLSRDIKKEQERDEYDKAISFRMGRVYEKLGEFENALICLERSREQIEEEGISYIFQDEMDGVDSIIQDLEEKILMMKEGDEL